MKPLILTVMFSGAVFTAVAQSPKQNIASSANEICPIKVGASIPPLKLPDVNGDLVDLNAAMNQKPTILIFYRGGWCPYCNRQLAQIRRIHSEVLALGYQVIAVSADRPEKLVETVQKDSLEYALLSDSKNDRSTSTWSCVPC